MNFEWNESQQALRTTLENFVKDRPDIPPQADLAALEGYDRNLLEALVEMGYTRLAGNMNTREELCDWLAGAEVVAGLGADVFVSLEVTARLFRGFCRTYGNHEVFSDATERAEQGELLAAVAVSDAAETKDDAPGAVIAEKTSEGWKLNGTKPYVTNAPICDKLLVSVLVEDKPAFALVDAKTSGVTVGERLATLGYEQMATAAVTFENVEIAEDHLAGPFDNAKPLEKLKETEDLVLCIAALATMDRAFTAAKQHALTTKREGKKLIKFQEISFKLAEIATQIQGGRQTLRRATWFLENGDHEAATVLRALKIYLAEAGERVASDALQVTAGKGYLADSDTARCYRDAKFISLAGTTSERARMAVADFLLERYGG